jgi:outer membrane protein, multidrug efflux system
MANLHTIGNKTYRCAISNFAMSDFVMSKFVMSKFVMSKFVISKPLYAGLIAGLLFLTSACKVTRPLIPDTVATPLTFMANDTTINSGTDTNSIANIKWAGFFADKKLKDLVGQAIKQNPDLLIAVQQIEKANAILMVRRNAFAPSITGVASAGVERYGDYTLNGVGNFDTNLSPNIEKDQKIPNPTPDYFLGLRSSWEIDLWGKLKNQRRAAAARYEKEKNAVRFLQTLLVSEVAEKYYELAALDNEIKIIKRNIALQQEALDIVKVQKEAGRATELAVQQFNAQLLFTKAAAYRVQQDLVRIENQLNNFLGRFPQSVARDSLRPINDYNRRMATGVPADMLLHRPDIREAEMELIAAKADVNAARAAFYPSLTITPFAGFNSFNASMFLNPASLAYGVVGGLTAPLFNQKRIKAAHQISLAENQEAYQQYRKTVINAYSEVVTQLNAIENLNKSYRIKQEEVSALKNALNNSRDLYLGGRASYLEIIAAQKVLLEAELQLNEIHRQQYTARIELYRSLGGGWQ